MSEIVSGKIAGFGLKIFKLGVQHERKRCIEYFKRCAKKIDFKGATPNEAIPILIEAMLESIKKIENEEPPCAQ